VLDDLERLFVQDLQVRDVALDETRGVEAHRRAFRPPRRAAAAARTPSCTFRFAHDLPFRFPGCQL
jgi:hypothetical protein